MIRAAVLGAALTIGGCAHRAESGPLALDKLLAFADPARCEPGAGHATLLGAMVAGDANQGFRAGRIDAAQPEASAFGHVRITTHDGFTVIGAPVRGTLFGLPITAVELSLPEGGDPGEAHYRFRAAPGVVERVLAARGFPVKLGQSVSLGPPDGYEHFIELIADPHHPGHALLSCGYQ